MPAWKKNSPEQIARFDALAKVPGAERGVMFGSPIYELNGERYATLNQGNFVLRLAPKDLEALIAKGGKPFEPIKGRKSKERVVVPPAIVEDSKALKAWVAKAVKFALAG